MPEQKLAVKQLNQWCNLLHTATWEVQLAFLQGIESTDTLGELLSYTNNNHPGLLSEEQMGIISQTCKAWPKN